MPAHPIYADVDNENPFWKLPDIVFTRATDGGLDIWLEGEETHIVPHMVQSLVDWINRVTINDPA